ncbi:MAG: GntR family transcriptional regulator [Spirochaetaceae bacterium]|nr:GntR family transcriptional regulator [Spirochaetaceae bacterium]
MVFQEERPIYIQLMDEIKGQIAAGRLAPGAKLDSIRELAVFYTVNPNTIQRALSELERGGLLITKRAGGKVVTEDQVVIKSMRSRMAAERMEGFLSAMESLGFSAGETSDLFNEAQKARQGRSGVTVTAKRGETWER